MRRRRSPNRATCVPLLSERSGQGDQGNLYIADSGNGRLRKVDAVTKIITTAVVGPREGPQSSNPRGIAFDAHGNLYFADSAYGRVRRVDAATGTITTIAGNGAGGFSGDGGAATASSLATPLGVAVEAFGFIYIADRYNQRIRAVAPVGVRRRSVRR